MERNYESEKKKRELVYPLDFKIIHENIFRVYLFKQMLKHERAHNQRKGLSSKFSRKK